MERCRLMSLLDIIEAQFLIQLVFIDAKTQNGRGVISITIAARLGFVKYVKYYVQAKNR